MEKIRYNHLNSYFKNIFGERTLKICVDGGFSCPNRQGICGLEGCIFCGERGAGDNLFAFNCIPKINDIIKSIQNQVDYFLNSYKGDRADKFVVYFQNFSNTFDSVPNLKKRYDCALACSDKIVGLDIATRPDLIDEDVCSLLASYKDRYRVICELGLQTANDNIGKFINRGFDKDVYVRAVNLLKRFGIEVVTHIMIGLPKEEERDICDTIRLINECGCNGVKIHSTFVLKDTRLEELYKNGDYIPISLEYYVDVVAKIISNLNKTIIIHRITGDPPKDKLVAPLWTARKKIVLNEINNILNKLDIVQGDGKYSFVIN